MPEFNNAEAGASNDHENVSLQYHLTAPGKGFEELLKTITQARCTKFSATSEALI
jgi:hypothetical protein